MRHYRGRFAPSPTGPLHFGSLIAAVGSYLQAKSCGGEWLLRIEDIDPPREVPGATDDILQTLEAFGLYWDSTPMYQSERSEVYLEALDKLHKTGLTYHCSCSRKDIAAITKHNNETTIYPATCRSGTRQNKTQYSIRINTERTSIEFTDQVQGDIEINLEKDVGDFVIRRADGYFAYQLAVIVDDAAQGITEIVRGCDLLELTPGQIYLQRLLDISTPDFIHLPIAVNGAGQKLSKQTYAPALDSTNPVPALYQVLRFLGQQAPPELAQSSLSEFWDWAIENWDVKKASGKQHLVIEDG
jgi:glutamyl-Q tRNA(Asp) synthetase